MRVHRKDNEKKIKDKKNKKFYEMSDDMKLF